MTFLDRMLGDAAAHASQSDDSKPQLLPPILRGTLTSATNVCSLSAALAKGVLNNQLQTLRKPRLESVTSTARFLIQAELSLRSNQREVHNENRKSQTA